MPVPVGRSLRLRQRLPPAMELAADLCFSGEAPTAPIVWGEFFSREAPIEIEVGFGKGRHLLHTAALRPETNFLGIEHSLACIQLARYHAQQRGITNLKLVDGEALAFFTTIVPAASVAAIHVYFPDPWPKSRHHKRRLVSPAFATAAARALAPYGLLHLATDHDGYALVIAPALASEPALLRHDQVAFTAALAALTTYGSKAVRDGKTLKAWTYEKRPD